MALTVSGAMALLIPFVALWLPEWPQDVGETPYGADEVTAPAPRGQAENPLTTARYDVLSIPTAILFVDGEAKTTMIGARPRSHYERALAEVLPAA